MKNKKPQVPIVLSFNFLDEGGDKWHFSYVWDRGGFSCELVFPADADPIEENFDQLTKWFAPGPLDRKHMLNIFRALNSGGMSKKFVKLGHKALLAELFHTRKQKSRRRK